MGHSYTLELEGGKVVLKKDGQPLNSWTFSPGLFERWSGNELFLNILIELIKDGLPPFEAKVIASLLAGRIEEKVLESKYFGSKA